MKAYITSVSEPRPSRHGGNYYLVTFKEFPNTPTARSYISYVSPENRNYPRWREVFSSVSLGKSVLLDGLVAKNGKLINADSRFVVVEIKDKEVEIKDKEVADGTD